MAILSLGCKSSGALPSDAGMDGAVACTAAADCRDENRCNGLESCIAGVCRRGPQAPDGTRCDPSEAEGVHYCVSGNCAPTRCGDGIIDIDNDERCDDGNDVPSDGCENTCTFTCIADEDCADDVSCNGDETCDPISHTCQPGTHLPNGEPCGADLVCAFGQCVPIGCGNGVLDEGEVCDDGNVTNGDGCDIDCTYSCLENADCQDSDECTTNEVCYLTTHACEYDALECASDEDACTSDACDPEAGCAYFVIDADGDGHSPNTLGACGSDCDDQDDEVHDDASELCDGKDNDCDGDIDESPPTWWVDCDNDGFASASADSLTQCDEPARSAACAAPLAGRWTTTSPEAGAQDCRDDNAEVYPYPADDTDAWHATAVEGAPTSSDFDYDCDGSEEQRYTFTEVDSSYFCSMHPFGLGCIGISGWTGSSVPSCGETATYSSCLSFGGGCTRLVTSRTQTCR